MEFKCSPAVVYQMSSATVVFDGFLRNGFPRGGVDKALTHFDRYPADI